MTIDPDKDFAGFAAGQLLRAWMTVSGGQEALRKAYLDSAFKLATADDIPAIEDLARYFDRAAGEIRSIAKVIRRRHGITAEDEHQRWCEAMKKRRA